MLMTKLRKDDRGFTLIELMMVIVILGILTGVAVPMMSRMKKNAWTAKLEAAADSVATAIISDSMVSNEFPYALDDLVKLPDGVGYAIQPTGTGPAAPDFGTNTAMLAIFHVDKTDNFQIQAYYPDGASALFKTAKTYEVEYNLPNAVAMP